MLHDCDAFAGTSWHCYEYALRVSAGESIAVSLSLPRVATGGDCASRERSGDARPASVAERLGLAVPSGDPSRPVGAGFCEVR